MTEPLCARCEHALSKHCPGNVTHGYHKEDMWPVSQRRHNTVCTKRHCNNPLCSCIEFIEPKPEAA